MQFTLGSRIQPMTNPAEKTPQPKQEQIGMISIQRAEKKDLDTVWTIIENCAKWLADQGLRHWADHYTKDILATMIQKLEVYVATQNGTAVSTITFGMRPPKYYLEEGYVQRFTDPEALAAYVMALGVLPGYQRKGIAGKMVEFVEALAKQHGVTWLRLDCRLEVPGIVPFYERRGFRKVGEPLQEGEGESYWLMEKNIGK